MNNIGENLQNRMHFPHVYQIGFNVHGKITLEIHCDNLQKKRFLS